MALWGIGLGWRWLSILLDFAGWIVFLVGLSILQHRCDVVTSSTLNTFGEDGGISSGVFFVPVNNQLGGVTSDLPLLPATNHLIGTSDYFNTPSRCRYLYSFPWWLMAYQFFLLVIYAILHTRKATYGTSRAALAALTAYGLYLATEVTDYFFHIRYSALGSPYRLSGPIKAVFAGALVMAAAKGFLLLGLLFPHEEEVGRKVTKVEATTYTTAATPPTVSHV